MNKCNFADYILEVEEAFDRLFGIKMAHTNFTVDYLEIFWADDMSADEVVQAYGEKYDLIYREEKYS